MNKIPNIKRDIIGKTLQILSVNKDLFNTYGELNINGDEIELKIHSLNKSTDHFDEVVNILARCGNFLLNIKAENVSSCWSQFSESIWHQAKFICKDILITRGCSIEKKINLIKLYIKDLDEFIRVTDEIRDINLGKVLEVGCIISPIDIGSIKDNIDLSFNFDYTSGGGDTGYYCYNTETKITPYVSIIKKNDECIDIETAKKLIYEFIVLYSILTGKNEVFNSIELKNVNRGKAEFLSQPQWLFSNSFQMNESEEQTKWNDIFNNKYSMFNLGKGISDNIRHLYVMNYELPDSIFSNFFKHSKIEIYKLFYESRFTNKYEKFINLCSCLDIFLSDVRDLYFLDTDIDTIKSLITNYLKEKNTYRYSNIKDFTDKITNTNNTKTSLLQKITRYFNEENSEQKIFINRIDERILENDLFKQITDIRNHIAHGRIHKIEKLQVCTDILELITYYLLLDNIGIAKSELIRLHGYIDFNRVKNNL